jgi:hypothetical protein
MNQPIQSIWATVQPSSAATNESRVTRIHHLSPVENRGKRNAYFRVFQRGIEVRGPQFSILHGWDGMSQPPNRIALDKPTSEPAANAPLGAGKHWFELLYNNQPSQRVTGIHTDYPDEPQPEDGLGGNTRFHHSFEIHFEVDAIYQTTSTINQRFDSLTDQPPIPDHIFGMHDPGTWEQMVIDAGRTAWCVHTEAIGHDPNDHKSKQFKRPGITPIVRLNNGYEPAGTIPTKEHYTAFAQRCANYVAASDMDWVIIGNEIGLQWEWPHNQPIPLADYIACYRLCHAAIKAVRPTVRVLPQAVAPWNITLGDWCYQLAAMLQQIGIDNLDGIPLHIYTHGHDPALIRSTATMNPPFDHRHYHMAVLWDFLEAVPNEFKHLPVIVTECNPCGWQDENNGWIQAAYQFIDDWNRNPNHQPVLGLCFYRWQMADWGKYWISNKQAVIEDFRAALEIDRRIPKPLAPDPRPTAYTTHRLNLRRTPGLNGKSVADIITVLEQGESVWPFTQTPPTRIDGIQWRYISTARHGNGWVANHFLQESN